MTDWRDQSWSQGQYDRLTSRAERAEAENTELRAKIAAVRALANLWRTEPAEDISARAALARVLLAALDGGTDG